MNCLINQPKDVMFLCSDGIITRFSQENQNLADLFNTLGGDIAFIILECSSQAIERSTVILQQRLGNDEANLF
jgi:hypothetical protein